MSFKFTPGIVLEPKIFLLDPVLNIGIVGELRLAPDFVVDAQFREINHIRRGYLQVLRQVITRQDRSRVVIGIDAEF